jgi:large subunit ribosomal protein L25
MIFKINAVERNTVRKSDLKNLRKEGMIPAVVYGHGVEPLSITLDKIEFMKLYKKSFNELVFYEVKIAKNEYHTLIKERQMHPVSREILHVDFMVIPPHQMIEVDVPIKFVGTPIGAKSGGFIDILHRSLRIQCVEDAIPNDIEVDITNLNVGEAFHIHQIPAGKWTIKDNPENALVTIHAKKAEAVVEAKPEEAPEEKK